MAVVFTGNGIVCLTMDLADVEEDSTDFFSAVRDRDGTKLGLRGEQV
jgi:hypothetical protein